MRAMMGFDALRAHSRITWIDQAQGWIAAPEDIVTVLANEGFEECKRETTTSRRDRQPGARKEAIIDAFRVFWGHVKAPSHEATMREFARAMDPEVLSMVTKADAGRS